MANFNNKNSGYVPEKKLAPVIEEPIAKAPIAESEVSTAKIEPMTKIVKPKIERVKVTKNIKSDGTSSYVADGNNYDFDIFYAEAWSKKQGQFSFKLANNLVKYLKDNNKKVSSVLDICSGSGEFLSVVSNSCPNCVGCDRAEGYLAYCRSTYRDIKFFKVDKFESFECKDRFDLITCNHDVVNMFERFDQWETFFKTVFNLLKPNGIFMFDFYSEFKLKGWANLIYEQSPDIDYISKVYNQSDKCVFNEVYYLKQSTDYYRKTSDIMVESYYPTEQILDAVKKAGFNSIQPIDMSIKPIELTEKMERVHILAKKGK